MALLGISIPGTIPLTTFPQSISASVTISGASGTGIAGSVGGQVSSLQIGVSAIGVARALVASLALSISGVSGGGVAGSPVISISTAISGVAATGVGRSAGINDQSQIAPATAIGTAGQINAQTTTPIAFGVSGGGVAGAVTANPSKQLLQAAGIGNAGSLAVMISGGGGSKPLRRDPRMHTGFQRVKPRPQPVIAEPERKIQPPPTQFVRAPIMRPPMPPTRAPALVDPGLVPDAAVLLRQIVEAEAASRRQRQDEQDIAELLAFLDAQEKT